MDCVMLVKGRLFYVGIDGLLMKKEMVLCVRCWQLVVQFQVRLRDFSYENNFDFSKGKRVFIFSFFNSVLCGIV